MSSTFSCLVDLLTVSICEMQGYIVYSVKNKLKSEYLGLPGEEIKNLKMSGVQVGSLTITYFYLKLLFEAVTLGVIIE